LWLTSYHSVVELLPQPGSIKRRLNQKNTMSPESEMPEHRPRPQWAVLVNEQLFPMPRRHLSARDVLDQSGAGHDVLLVRDHEAPNDSTFEDTAKIDLAEGNVFRTAPRCEAKLSSGCTAPAKLAFVVDNDWEVTLIPRQTGYSLKRLMDLPDEVELFRDIETPTEEPIRDQDPVLFAQGPVFVLRHRPFEIKINTKPVQFIKRRVTGLEIKETAVKQHVDIKVSFVLYALKPDGGLGPVIRDDEKVELHDCAEFSCVAPDDKS
jgi:hypothetical protein